MKISFRMYKYLRDNVNKSTRRLTALDFDNVKFVSRLISFFKLLPEECMKEGFEFLVSDRTIYFFTPEHLKIKTLNYDVSILSRTLFYDLGRGDILVEDPGLGDFVKLPRRLVQAMKKNPL